MGLSALQERVVRRFFSLPESVGFVLAGGGALVVHQVVERSTKDLDLFGGEARDVPVAAAALRAALLADGLTCEPIHQNPTFVRLRCAGDGDATEVDIAFDASSLAPVQTALGPARSPQELAVDKLLALFSRAQARDFVDVHALAGRFGIDEMLRGAAAKDAGFSTYRLAEALGAIVRLPRQEFEVDDRTYAELQNRFADIRAELIRRTVDGDGEA